MNTFFKIAWWICALSLTGCLLSMIGIFLFAIWRDIKTKHKYYH